MDARSEESSIEPEAPNAGVLRKLGSSKLTSEVGKHLAAEMCFYRQQEDWSVPGADDGLVAGDDGADGD